MLNYEANKYYVFGVGYNGMNIRDLEIFEPDGVFDNFEDAMKEVDRLWDEDLAPDEATYIYHNGVLEEV